MATNKQKKAFKLYLENPSLPMGEIMRRAGYSVSSSLQPHKLTQSKSWEQLKEIYLDDEKALLTLNQLADESNTDKDNRLKASIEILKLKDRYPKEASKVVGFFAKLESIKERPKAVIEINPEEPPDESKDE